MAQKNNSSFEELLDQILPKFPVSAIAALVYELVPSGYTIRFKNSRNILETTAGKLAFDSQCDALHFMNNLTFCDELEVVTINEAISRT